MQALAEIEPLKSWHELPNEQIEQAESAFLTLPQKECPLVHKFAPGLYMREILMPKGAFVIGHQHLTQHFNIVLTGRAAVMMDGVLHDIEAPAIFVSEPGVRKVLYILETMRWATAHPTDLTDLRELEDTLIVKSECFKAHEEMKVLQDMVAKGEIQ